MSKLKSIWKERADQAHVEPRTNWGPSPLEGLRVQSFDEIRQALGDAMKRRMPQSAHAVDDPTSNLSQLLNALAEVSADQFKQIEVIAQTMEKQRK